MNEESGPPDYDIRITAGNPSDEEVAAVTAVLGAALEELASASRRREGTTASAWERSQRAVRTPLTPGAWMTFGA